MTRHAAFCLFLLLPNGALAQILDRESMQLVQETAQAICGEIIGAGENREIEIEGEVNAELRGLARRLADAGIEGSARLEDGSYAGVLREELASERQDARDCRRQVFDRLMDRIDSAPPTDETGELDPDPGIDPMADFPGGYAELAGMVVWGPYINCSVYNDAPALAQVTSINYMLYGMFGPQPVSMPCTYNCLISGYNSSVFSGPPNNHNVTNGSCSVTAMR